MKGIDVSEMNGSINWQDVIDDGNEFVIIRLGWGNCHLDSKFYENFNSALDAGLKVGVYYYSEATNKANARLEAKYASYIMKDAGITPDMMEMGFWFDEENDSWKQQNGLTDPGDITNVCAAFINTLADEGYLCGLYANYYYLTNVIDMSKLSGVDVWCAQYNNQCDYPDATLWQYTDSHYIGYTQFDGDMLL